jgi:acyl-CoA synthetase (AMP-forming)/AMP-acid ligase II
VNFARDLVDCAERGTVALVELAREGERHEWTFAEVGAAATKLAGYFTAQGLRRGDIVLIWLGNRSEWVLSMLACFRLGLVAASCPEQLRSKDLRLRIEAISPTLIVADERNRRELERVRPSCPVAWVPHPEPFESAPPARAAELDSTGPCHHLHLGHLGDAEAGTAPATLPHRPVAPGGALDGRAARRRRLVYGVERVEQRARATRSSRHGCAEGRHSFTTRDSIP